MSGGEADITSWTVLLGEPSGHLERRLPLFLFFCWGLPWSLPTGTFPCTDPPSPDSPAGNWEKAGLEGAAWIEGRSQGSLRSEAAWLTFCLHPTPFPERYAKVTRDLGTPRDQSSPSGFS